MNKLRKQRPQAGEPSTASTYYASKTSGMSRTMQLAVMSPSAEPRDDMKSASLQRDTWFFAPLITAPRTKVEQYWAARALVAETLLSAHDRHQAELADVRRMEAQKREQEIGVVLGANDQRQRRLERVMMSCLAIFLVFVAWVVMKITPDRDAKSKPSHFTIPILSPFTSVVEHETGVFGTKAVAIFIVVIGIAAYVALKHRGSQWRIR